MLARPRLVSTLLAAFALLFLAAAVRADPISVETMFRKAQNGDAVLSPSGRYLAVLRPVNERQNLVVIDLDDRSSQTVTGLTDHDVLNVFWLGDGRLVFTYGEIDRASGEPPRAVSVVAIDRDGKNQRDLRRGFQRPWAVAILRGVPGTDEVFATARDRNIGHADLYRLDTRTGRKNLLSFETPGNVGTWVLDLEDVPRAIVTNDLRGDRTAWYFRKDANSAWVLGGESRLGETGALPLAFGPSGTLFVRARKGDRTAVYRYDTESGKLGEALIELPGRDVQGNFVIDRHAHALLGYRYVDDRPTVAWFNEEYARVQKGVDTALPDTVNAISKARQGDRWLVTAHSDRDPGSVYLLDAKTSRMEKVLDYRPWIKPAEMARQKWVRYPARDGRTIPALLTLPNGSDGKRVPLVVDIHGGPYVPATTWGFRPSVQFFASRGYAVLQPQFRGTDGFGGDHYAAGFRQWGAAMQDDLVDGVAWAVAQGHVDKDRVCYYGGSYGGYAALWGAIRDRDVIQCAVAYVAVSSIDYLFDATTADNAAFMDRSSGVRERIGDPAKDRERWKRVNPVDNAERVGVPILLAYGLEDRRVPIQHGNDMRSALDRYGKTYEWVTYAGEAHGFNKTENVVDFYRRVEKFLARYLDKP